MAETNLRNILSSYSEWLDGEGLVVSDRAGGTRPHETLVQDFLAQTMLAQWSAFLASQGMAGVCDCLAHVSPGRPCTCDCGHDPLLPAEDDGNDQDGCDEAAPVARRYFLVKLDDDETLEALAYGYRKYEGGRDADVMRQAILEIIDHQSPRLTTAYCRDCYPHKPNREPVVHEPHEWVAGEGDRFHCPGRKYVS